MQDPSWRATGYTDACDATPASERARKIELLSQAVLQARNVKDPHLAARLWAEVPVLEDYLGVLGSYVSLKTRRANSEERR
jgi:hypothetical protein